jgi:hypothetical protein
MQHEAMITTLKSIKLYGMAQAVDELASQGSPAYQSAQEVLGTLLKAEMAEREVRSIAYQMKASKFPVYRDLASFDFSQSVVNEALIRQLHRCEFLDQVHNVVLVGGPGTGKTHLATALGVQAVQHQHRRVRYFSTIELVYELGLVKAAMWPGSWSTWARRPRAKQLPPMRWKDSRYASVRAVWSSVADQTGARFTACTGSWRKRWDAAGCRRMWILCLRRRR